MLEEEAGSAGREAITKHKRKTYGRSVIASGSDTQLKLV
jgi:hypothetical protein